MAKRDRLSGNEAVAIALRQINPDVFPAFPITPSTEIPQYFASFAANGEVDTEFIPVESEHSSMSAAIGASCRQPPLTVIRAILSGQTGTSPAINCYAAKGSLHE